MNVDVLFDKNNAVFTCDFKEVTTIHGATFTPHISEEGVLTWTNDKSLPNPAPISVKGVDGYTPVKGVDYFTEEDKADLKMLRYDAQSLTETQKEQVRKNIGAADDVVIGKIEHDENLTEMFGYANAYLNINGQVVTNDEGRCTDYIAVSPGDVFVWTGFGDVNSIRCVCEYDANKNFIGGDPLVTESYAITRNVYYTVKRGAYVRFCSFWDCSLVKTKQYDGITVLNDKTEEYSENLTNGYVNYEGKYFTNAEAVCTDYIPAMAGDVFIVSGYAQYNIACVCFYNADKMFLSSAMYDFAGYTADNEKVVAPDFTGYVRFSSFFYNSYPLRVKKYEMLPLKHAAYRLNEMAKQTQAGNVLWGKKYVACGDSFTEGPFSEKNEETWDDSLGVYKTYPWHIASRNSMSLVNEAKSGSTMYNNGATNAFSVTRYTQVPTDADYITLCFGLNETNATIGTLEDATNETIMGAWNIVLEYLITNMPYAKIGIIIPDAWISADLRDAMINVAEYWGIPYLDLSGDPKVPLLIGGKRGGAMICSKARELRTAAFAVSADDTHPNPKGHAYRSTIIENFMRSL